MGNFACYCGYVISDSTPSCSMTGELRGEPEVDWLGTEVQRVVADFLPTVKNNQRESWIRNYFEDEYPLDLSLAMVIDHIYTKIYNEKGHSVYQCPECERLYLQKELNTNGWTCFEKRK